MTGWLNMVMSGSKGYWLLLNDVLDRIDVAELTPMEAARSLGASERLAAAIVHLSALIGAEPSSVCGNEVVLNGLTLTLAEAQSPGAPLWYADLDVGFTIEGGRLANEDGPETMTQLLDLCLYARDRSDTLLYLPQSERALRVAALVARTGASERFVRFTLAHFRSIRDEIAA
jgi:hypothetical protein